jgi:hypothetical protein
VIAIRVPLLFLALLQTPSPKSSAPTILDQRYLPGLGHVTLSGGGHRLRLEIGDGTSARSQEFEIDDLPENAKILSAAVGSFVREGMVAALAIGEGETTSYHLLLSAHTTTSAETIRSAGFSAAAPEWSLTRAVFVSSGEPYRIAEIHDPGGDALEITFRRGWPQLDQAGGLVDEKILYSSHGLAGVGPHVARWRETGELPWANLVEVVGVRRAGQGH